MRPMSLVQFWVLLVFKTKSFGCKESNKARFLLLVALLGCSFVAGAVLPQPVVVAGAG